jgi:hypothetical protein
MKSINDVPETLIMLLILIGSQSFHADLLVREYYSS